MAWKDVKHPQAKPVFVELYDLKTDPAETVNIAEQQPELLAELMAQLDSGWKGSLPPSAN